MAGLAYSKGRPDLYIYGADSFGNVCGHSNSKTIDVANSGLDMTARPCVACTHRTHARGCAVMTRPQIHVLCRPDVEQFAAAVRGCLSQHIRRRHQRRGAPHAALP